MNRYNFNPCDLERFRVLAPIGDAAAALYLRLTAGTDCPCCLGMRVGAVVVIAFTLGAVLL